MRLSTLLTFEVATLDLKITSATHSTATQPPQRWRTQMANRRIMARPATLRAPSQLPVAMKATRLSTTPPRTSICRDECPVTMLETIRRSLTPLGSTIRERPMQMRIIRQVVLDMRAMLDKGPTVLPTGDMMTVEMLDFHTVLNRQPCRPLVLRRTAQDRPLTSTSTRQRPRPNVRTTRSSTACRNRRPNRTWVIIPRIITLRTPIPLRAINPITRRRTSLLQSLVWRLQLCHGDQATHRRMVKHLRPHLTGFHHNNHQCHPLAHPIILMEDVRMDHRLLL